jgi:hypothetical protein
MKTKYVLILIFVAIGLIFLSFFLNGKTLVSKTLKSVSCDKDYCTISGHWIDDVGDNWNDNLGTDIFCDKSTMNCEEIIVFVNKLDNENRVLTISREYKIDTWEDSTIIGISSAPKATFTILINPNEKLVKTSRIEGKTIFSAHLE